MYMFKLLRCSQIDKKLHNDQGANSVVATDTMNKQYLYQFNGKLFVDFHLKYNIFISNQVKCSQYQSSIFCL